MKTTPLHRLALTTALLASTALLTGCNLTGGGDARVQTLEAEGQASPLRSADLQTFEDQLFRQLNTPASLRNEFRILDTADAENGTYILYSLGVNTNDALAFAQRSADGTLTIREPGWKFTPVNSASDPVVVKAVPPGNPANPKYGVLAGRIYNPYIESIEINYRDGHHTRHDVTHTRGFISIRKAFDPRFVQVRAYGMNGNPYWQIDTR